jgi:hypothetical protein
VASGEDPDIIFDHVVHEGHCEDDAHSKYKIKTFNEINLNDPFPNTVKNNDKLKPFTASMTAKFES